MNLTDKDQAAIDHVASVSKNPHAAMIVKQLITGWDLKSNITGTIIKNTTWVDGSEWQLIEPKPAKPAYRVYIEPGDGEPKTVTRKHYDKHSDSYDNKVEWISDWIEYDQPKKWPTPLVERIAAIDLKAAQWIVDHWDDLLESKHTSAVSVGRESNELHSMFIWESSDQGTPYWQEIANKLGEQ